jgi:hypothetical protein
VHSPGKLRRRRHFADVGGVAFIAIGSVARVAWCGCCVFFFFFSISLSATSFFYDQGSRTRKNIWAMSLFSNSLRINLQTNREWKRMSCWNQRDSLIYKHVHITSGVEEKKKFYIGFVGVFFHQQDTGWSRLRLPILKWYYKLQNIRWSIMIQITN